VTGGENNWMALSGKDFGLCTPLAKIMLDVGAAPLNVRGPCLVVTSDYGGSHRQSSYEVYSVLLGDLMYCNAWRDARLGVRAGFLADGRRMSYKGLNDRQRRRALIPFLGAADLIPGLCISLAVSKSVDTLFERDVSPTNPELVDCLSWSRPLFERALRIVHVVSFWIAGLSRPDQDVLWFSDEDEIAANPARLTLLTKVWANVMNNYTVHPLRHLKCGTTKCDDGSKDIEDFAAVPDLVAGALSDLLTPIAGKFRPGVIVPLRLGAKAKATVIGHWLSRQNHRLRKVMLVIDKDPDSLGLTISRLSFNDLSSVQSVRLT
jgi:hypothetical protein